MPTRKRAASRGLHLAIFIAASSLLLLAVAAALSHSLPAFVQKAVSFLSSCPYRIRTQTPCPLCGGLTAFAALIHGNLEAARAANRLAVVLAPLVLLQFPFRLYRMVRPRLRWKEEAIVLCAGLATGIFLVFS